MSASENGHNVYVEGRTVRRGLGAKERSGLNDTVAVFALVVDSDNDKGKAWSPTVPVSLTVETSPGNKHFWLFLETALDPATAQKLGARLRAATNADDDTGNVCQPYRVAGTTNYPGKKKLERGRVVTGTRMLGLDDTLWTPARLEQEFPATTRTPTETQAPPPEDPSNFKVASKLADLPEGDLAEGITIDHLYPPEEIAALRAHGYTNDAIFKLTPKQTRKILGADPELIAAALAVIPHNDNDPHSENYWKEIEQPPGRNYMVRIGMAVKAACGEAGFPLFDKWRSRAPDYDADKVKKKWDGFHPTQIDVGTLFWLANKASPNWRAEFNARKGNSKGEAGGGTANDATTPVFDPWQPYIVPTFPLEILPPEVQDYVSSQSTIIGCDVSGMAMSALGTFSGATIILHSRCSATATGTPTRGCGFSSLPMPRNAKPQCSKQPHVRSSSARLTCADNTNTSCASTRKPKNKAKAKQNYQNQSRHRVMSCGTQPPKNARNSSPAVQRESPS